MTSKFLTLSLGALLFAGAAGAVQTHASVGTFVPANGAHDMAYDAQRDIVYISAGGSVLRYQVATGQFLAPITLGGTLWGLDLSPDGSTLAVADSTSTNTSFWVHLVDLATLADNKKVFTKDPNFPYESGTWATSYAANGDLFVTELFAGSGWVPMRKYTAFTGVWSAPYAPRQNTMVSASGDGTVIAFAEANISDGEWGLINDLTGAIVKRQGYTDGTSWFNYEIGTNAHATQFVIPTYGGAYVYDQNYKKVKVLGTYAGQQPVGIAYDPVRSIAYMPYVGTSEVRVFDMDAIDQTGALDVGKTFVSNGNGAFVNGRTRISRDGSLLMVQVAGGVQIDRLYAPLSAKDASAQVQAGKTVQIPVTGVLGVPAAFTFDVPSQPAHGKATVSGASIAYTPSYSFSGTEKFKFRVHYGQATATGTISVAVSPSVNQAPVAVADRVTLHGTDPALIDVLANDTDPEGQRLSIVSVTQPNIGTTEIQGRKILYTPPQKIGVIAMFTYTISDGHGGTASAPVNVMVRAPQ